MPFRNENTMLKDNLKPKVSLLEPLTLKDLGFLSTSKTMGRVGCWRYQEISLILCFMYLV